MTPEQVLALSDNDSIRKSGEKLARASQWKSLNASDHAAWGEIKGSGKEPYEVRFDLQDNAFKCSCPSRPQPCKHTLALMLLYTAEPNVFGQDAPPTWVTTWLSAHEAKLAKQAAAKEANADSAPSAPDPAAQAKRAADRESKVSAGIDALDLWLRDLVRSGFDGLPTRDEAFWEAPAARMIDSQAKGLANQLQEMSKIPATGTGWASSLLERAGMLYLLLEGYRHQEMLSPDLRADIRSIVGWTQKQDDLLDNAPTVRDQWLVLSQRTHEEDRMDVQRTWLRGLSTRQTALLLDFSFNNQPFELKLPAGTQIDADLIYYPSAYPQRALIKERRHLLPPQDVTGGSSIPETIAAYSEALSRQPWLNMFPMILWNVYPARTESGWILRDVEGHYLPLGAYVDSGWKLLAVSGDHEGITVFGEWDGSRLLALTVWVDGRIILL